MSIKVTSPPPVRNKQVTTQNIDTETITHHRAARPGHPVQRGHRESAPINSGCDLTLLVNIYFLMSALLINANYH